MGKKVSKLRSIAELRAFYGTALRHYYSYFFTHILRIQGKCLKGLSHEMDFKYFDKDLQNLTKLRDAAGFLII